MAGTPATGRRGEVPRQAPADADWLEQEPPCCWRGGPGPHRPSAPGAERPSCPLVGVCRKVVCECGYTREQHLEEATKPHVFQGKEWDPKKHVQEMPTDAFGDIVFTGLGQKVGKVGHSTQVRLTVAEQGGPWWHVGEGGRLAGTQVCGAHHTPGMGRAGGALLSSLTVETAGLREGSWGGAGELLLGGPEGPGGCRE